VSSIRKSSKYPDIMRNEHPLNEGERVPRPAGAAQRSWPGHRTLAWLWLLLLITAVASGGCGGCGCGKDKPKPRPRPRPTQKAQAKRQPAKKPKQEKKEKKEEKKEEEPEKPEAPSEDSKVAEEISRPENVADWKRDDYYSAKKDGDDRLVDAVKYLGEHFAGNPSAAQLLANLLKYEEPETEPEPSTSQKPGPKDTGRPKPRTGQPKRSPHAKRLPSGLIEAIVMALGKNATDAARQTLEAVLLGQFKTEDDKEATETAMQTLVDNYDPENEAVLYRVLTSQRKPQQPSDEKGPMKGPSRPGQKKIKAGDLRADILELLEPVASEQFRVMLAKRVLDPSTPREQFDLFWQFVASDSPDNLAAQILVYQSQEPNEQTKVSLEERFIRYGSDTLGHTLGILAPASQGPGGSRWGGLSAKRRPGTTRSSRIKAGIRRPKSRPGATSRDSWAGDPDLPYRLARHLWDAKFAATVTSRLGKAESPDQVAKQFMLASTLPMDKVRSELHQVLQRHAKDGPKALESAGMLDDVISDPALFILVKMLPRKEKSGTRSSTRPKSTSRSTKTSRGKTPRTLSSEQQAEEKLAQEWMQTSEDLLRLLCERFRTAAQVSTKAGQKPSKKSQTKSASGLPLELHSNETVVARYELRWPDNVQKKLADLSPDPLEVHYVRIEEKTSPTKMFGYYRRQLKYPTVHENEERIWIESMHTGSQPDRKLSVDVLITAGSADRDKSPDEDEELTVEIICIEVKDPQ